MQPTDIEISSDWIGFNPLIHFCSSLPILWFPIFGCLSHLGRRALSSATIALAQSNFNQETRKTRAKNFFPTNTSFVKKGRNKKEIKL